MKRKQPGAGRLYGRALRLWWKECPEIMGYYMLMTFFKSVIPFVILVAQARLIDEMLGGRELSRMAHILLIMLSLTTALGALSAYFKYQKNRYDRSLWLCMKTIFSDIFIKMPYSDFENPEVQAEYRALEQLNNWSGMGLAQVYQSILEFFETFLQILLAGFFSFSLVFSLAGSSRQAAGASPLLAFLFLLLFLFFSILAPVLSSMSMKKFYDLAASSTAGNRVFTWLFSLQDVETGMESRVYDQLDYALNLVGEDKAFTVGGILDQALRGPVGRLGNLSQLSYSTAMVLTYAYIAYLAWQGHISIASVSQYAGALTILNGGMNSFVAAVGEMKAQKDVLDRTFKLIDKAGDERRKPQSVETEKAKEKLQREETPVASGSQSPADAPVFETIEFRGVSFHYPGSERKVLSDLTLSIRAGETLAIVGRNGSGKSTFVKLLCRLYEPDEGEILIDGRPLAALTDQEADRLLSVVFQDSKLMSFTLGENVSAGAVKDPERVRASLKAAGIDMDEATPFFRGLDTPLQKKLDQEGVLVSGGEEQKISIARALYRDGALLVLDEPTAALDPLAEAEIYQHMNRMAKGKTAIFISHRLSSCRFSDRILVFDEGRVVEEGQHQELLDREGLYQSLWEAQAQYYTEKEA